MTSFHLRAIAAAARILSPCLLLCSSTLAWGQQPLSSSLSDTTAQSPAEATVVLMYDPREEDSLALVGSIEADLAGVPVRLIREPRARTELLTWLEAGRRRVKATGALGLFAVDVSRRDGWRLFFLEPDGIPTLIRRLRPIPEHAPLDEAGITVHLLVEGLLDGKHVEVTAPVLQEEPPEPAGPMRAPAHEKPQPSAPASQRRPGQPGSVPDAAGSAPPSAREESAQRVYPAVLVGLSTTKWLISQGWQSGVLIGAGLSLDRAWSLSLDYVWYPTLRYQSSDAAIRLSRHPFAGRVSYRASPGFSPVFSLGMWADAISRQTVEAMPGYRSTASATEPSWGLNASVGFASPRLWILSARLELGLDVAGRGVEFVVQNETAKTVLATSTVQPFSGVLLDFGL